MLDSVKESSDKFRKEMSINLAKGGGSFLSDFGNFPDLIHPQRKSIWGLLKDHITRKWGESILSEALKDITKSKQEAIETKKIKKNYKYNYNIMKSPRLKGKQLFTSKGSPTQKATSPT